MNRNVLLLERGCRDCAYVRVSVDFDKVEDDTFTGRNGEKIFIYTSSSPEATKLFAQNFGCKEVVPLLIKNDGEQIENIDEIIAFLKWSGYGKR